MTTRRPLTDAELAGVLRGESEAKSLPSSVFASVHSATQTQPQHTRHWWPAPKWRFQSMFSASKFVVAGVIVALLGGFLLTGVLRTQDVEPMPAASITTSEPTSAADVVSAFVTEEFEPGVMRVLSDGAGHDLAGAQLVDIAFGPDGTPWVLQSQSPWEEASVEVLKLGSEGSQRFENAYGLGGDIAVAPNGQLWALNLVPESGLQSFDGASWKDHELPFSQFDARTVDVTADGTVWVKREAQAPIPNRSVARLVDGTWTFLPEIDDPAWLETSAQVYWDDLAVTPDGTASLVAGGGLLQFDGEAWEYQEPVADRERLMGATAIGPDGTLWFYMQERRSRERHLARRDEDGWTIYSADDGIPTLMGNQVFAGRLAVDGGGTLWAFGHEYYEPEVAVSECGGVLSFDGTTWTQYLKGACVNHVTIAADGSVWAAAHAGNSDETLNPALAGLYVIHPERSGGPS